MAFNKELLKQNIKPLLGGVTLGMLLGAGAAGYAVFASQASGRKALEDIVKVTAELATCNASVKEASDGIAAAKAQQEKSEAEKASLQKQLAEAISEIDTLTANLKKAQTKTPEKPSAPHTSAQTPPHKPTTPSYIRRPAKPASREDAPRENWEDGL